MGRLVENLWDCKYCETVGIGGSKRDCPNCGRPRDEDIVFYLPTQKRYVPEAEAAKIDRNPDWVCNYCGALNPNGSENCISCGNQRDGEDQNYFENRAKKEVKEREEREQIEYNSNSRVDSVVPDEKRTAYDYFSGNERKYSRKLPINFKAVGIVLVVLLLVAGLIYLLLPKEKDVTITSMSWERSISIEEYRTVNESGWSVPVGGRIQYTRQEISHYQQVFDHYETKTRQVARQRYVGSREVVVGYRDLGNGYSEEITSSVPEYETYYENETYQEPVYRSEPVYATKYYYEIERWVYSRSVNTSGNDKSPYWGETRLSSKERESSRADRYWIKGIDEKEKEVQITLSYSDWESVEVGQLVKLKVSLGYGEIVREEE